MNDDPLQTPVRFLHGVGPERSRLLEKLGLHTVADLLWYLPRDVLDLTEVRAVSELETDRLQTVKGTVVDVDGRRISGGRSMSAVLIDCDGESARGVWFNQPWVLRSFHNDQTVLLSGKPKRRGGRWEFAHPRVQYIEDEDPHADGGLLPRYGLTDGLKMHTLRAIIRAAIDKYGSFVPEYLPESFCADHKLPTLSQAITQLHKPTDHEQYTAGRNRLIFDDLLEFQLALALRRRAWRMDRKSPALPTTAKIDARIRRLFPFSFTDGQNEAVQEIADDLARDSAMHRLLQADVGAGKTAVAIYAMLIAVAAGYQAVLMAPTEVLASQHWATVEQMLANSRIERRLFTGNLTATERKQTLSDIANGDLQLIVGTQSVIQKDVEFHNLGLVIIDEQHKFGVLQRAQFSHGEDSPHVLVMTATPIPRSLCLTQYGDLDATIISDLPPGRQPVVTSRVAGGPLCKRAWDFLRKQLRSGRQAYVICPRVEAASAGLPDANDRNSTSVEDFNSPDDLGAASDSDAGRQPAISAEEAYQQLQSDELREFRLGIVHGQMDRQSKAAAMDAFRSGKTQVLVSTTVVEVGVDVPNATLMVINQAERFGLSQLHQLRGRISRGKFQGYCFLFSEATAPDAVRRLNAMESTSDGFKIAEVDFEIRGPGDVLGTRQHGELPLKVADLSRDRETLLEARKAAFSLVESEEFDGPAFAPLKIRVLDRFGTLMDLPQSG